MFDWLKILIENLTYGQTTIYNNQKYKSKVKHN